MKYLFMLLLVFTVSCSNKSKNKTVKSKMLSDSKDASQKGTSPEDDFILDGDNSAINIDKSNDQSNSVSAENDSQSISLGSGVAELTVEKDETLMMIAFKLYGNYEKWREISNLNNNITSVVVGQKIKYNVPSEKFEWHPEGTPFLIKDGDTLGSISEEKYGTKEKWKFIYDNNKPLIRDPNLIFAGFTIYYKELGSDTIASNNNM